MAILSLPRSLLPPPPPPPPHPLGFRRSPARRRRSCPSATPRIWSELSFSVGTHLIPHPKKAETGGEDAFFVSSFNGGVLAIADGVSGWAEQNVNPALFSRELMANASDLVMDEEVSYNPQILLKKAHAATSSIGSATAIIAMLEISGTLKIANVGDCGLRILRKGNNAQIIARFSLQVNWFSLLLHKNIFSTVQLIGQTYRDATLCSVQLTEGDTIVMGSDGLFDNVFDHEIVSVISKVQNAVEAAKALAELASNHSVDTTFDSPYSLEARNMGFDVPWWQKVFGKKLIGGKLDDITVIVGQVIRSSID